MKDSKNISFLLIPYLTVCAALYHIAFWDTFNLNGLSFISISDIIKSSLYPIFSILFIIIFNLTIQNLVIPKTFDNENKRLPKKKITNLKVILAYLGFQILLIIILYFTKSFKDPYNWIWFGLLDALFPSILLINNGFLNNQFVSEDVRRYVIELLVFLPVFSYCAGKYQSTIIQQNIKYKYSINANINPTINHSTSSDTLKFIGNTDKHFLFTDLENSKIIFIKSDNIDTLILYDKK